MEDTMHKMIGKSLVKDSEDLIESERRVKRSASYYHRNKSQLHTVAEAFRGKIEVQSASVEDGTFDINVTGDHHVLNAVFGIFRKLGYEPSQRPGKEPAASFSCYWEHPEYEAKFWFWFTSSVCARKQIGTEMKEVPVYETVCE